MASDVRQQNRQRVLAVLLDWLNEGITQADIEQATGLSRGKVSATLDDLQPILRPETGPVALAPSRGGRRARLFRLRTGIGGIGIDFGRSHIRVGVQRLHNSKPRSDDIAGRQELDFDVAKKPTRALDLAAKLLDELLRRPDSPTEFAGICVSLAAPIASDGRVRAGPFQTWTDLNLRSEILERLQDERLGSDCRVLVNNDANLSLKAELRWGAARGANDALYLKWATGIGAALCIDSKVVRGSGGIAGELGHTVVPAPSQGVCEWCGHRCLESVASLGALRPDARRRDLAQIASDPKHVAHEQLKADIDRAGALIGMTLAPLVNAVNPAVVIIGGLGPESFPNLCIPPIASVLEASIAPSIARDLKIRPGMQTNGASVLGALAAVFDELVPDHLLQSL
jgi:predicted NBD/HSP70 family sugar kinase